MLMKHKNPPILLALKRRQKKKGRRKVAKEICFNAFAAEKGKKTLSNMKSLHNSILHLKRSLAYICAWHALCKCELQKENH